MPSTTPFFQAFGPLLFRRCPKKAIENLRRVRSPGELYELFGEMLPDRLLAMNDKGTGSRDRAFTPKVTFWAFVSQVFDVGSSCRDVVRKVEAWWRWTQRERTGEPALSPSAYCQARARLEMRRCGLSTGISPGVWSAAWRARNSGWGGGSRSSMAPLFRCPIRLLISAAGRNLPPRKKAWGFLA